MSANKTLAGRSVLLIVVSYLAILGLLGIVTKVGLDNLDALNESLRMVVQQNNVKAKHINRMRDMIRERMLLLNKTIHLDDPFEIDESWEEYSRLAGEYLLAREKLTQMPLTSDQKDQLAKQPEILGEAQRYLDGVINAIRRGNLDKAQKDILIAYGLNHQVTSELQQMSELQQTIAENAVSASGEAMAQARIRIIALMLVVVGLASVVLLVVVKVIGKQARKVDQLVEQLEDANVGLENKVTERTNELLSTREENARMGAELAVTNQLQQMLLPPEKELQQVPDLEIAAAMSPAEEAGGDYYDVLQYNDKMIIGVGDVTGHGLESSVVMLMVQTAVRTLAVTGEMNMVKFVAALNKVIYDNLQRIDSYKNLTFILTYYDNGQLTLCGQHEEFLLIRKDSKVVERIDTVDLGFPLGLEENIEAFLNTHQLDVNPGDTVVLYTDGIPEAEDAEGNYYGVDRLCEQVIEQIDKPVQQLHDEVIKDLHAHIADHTIFDDITLLVIRRKES